MHGTDGSAEVSALYGDEDPWLRMAEARSRQAHGEATQADRVLLAQQEAYYRRRVAEEPHVSQSYDVGLHLWFPPPTVGGYSVENPGHACVLEVVRVCGSGEHQGDHRHDDPPLGP